MVTDHISNLIIKIKNAGTAGHETVSFPYSKMTESILNLLQKEGYIKSFAKKGKKVIKTVDIELAYEDGVPRITDVERISKFSKRSYRGVSDIRKVMNGFGMMVITTSKGVLSDKEAKKMRVGGEALFKIW